MRTMQGIASRKRGLLRLAMAIAAYTLLFLALVALGRALFADRLSELIVDATSVWVAVPDGEVELFRSLGYQEGGMANGMHQFRDLSDYHAVVGFIEGPLLWSAYLLGAMVVAACQVTQAARDIDEIVCAVSNKLFSSGSDCVDDRLPNHLSYAARELCALDDRISAMERASAAAEARKDELVAYLAHDIKTPLTSVVGYLALLAEEPDLPRDKRERFAGTALEKARRLDSMMDEFFEITRYNLTSIPIQREHVDAAMLLVQVVDEVFPAAAARGVEVVANVPPGSVVAFVDPEKMARVLSNIVRNGVSFAEPGTQLACSLSCEDSEGEGRIVYRIRNKGREIPPEHLEHIFEKFYRADRARGTDGGNAGLGLAIAREIVLAHGGEISATSSKGETEFTASLPLGD